MQICSAIACKHTYYFNIRLSKLTLSHKHSLGQHKVSIKITCKSFQQFTVATWSTDRSDCRVRPALHDGHQILCVYRQIRSQDEKRWFIHVSVQIRALFVYIPSSSSPLNIEKKRKKFTISTLFSKNYHHFIILVDVLVHCSLYRKKN